ncbi:carboxylesterase [Acidocella sp.]|uniref:alpha/beta hydrolase n=1 Tax=Acidocella sp. TaxID=50710 RepID=UPI00260A97AC|nr:alpha/beta hydrolase [Acidocella sp.]
MPHVTSAEGVDLAYEFQPGKGPALVFCPGYASDMTGGKALALLDFAKATGRAMLRFDYAGHGASGGLFTQGTIGSWRDDARAIIEHVLPGQDILLIGSSMGGWISLLLARELGARVTSLVLIAPAPDFTERLVRHGLDDEQKAALARDGVIHQPSQYGPPQPFTLKLLEDGARHLLLHAPIAYAGPVRILHGLQDDAVPWKLSEILLDKLESQDVELVFVKDGDHRLARPRDLALLTRIVAALLGEDG